MLCESGFFSAIALMIAGTSLIASSGLPHFCESCNEAAANGGGIVMRLIISSAALFGFLEPMIALTTATPSSDFTFELD